MAVIPLVAAPLAFVNPHGRLTLGTGAHRSAGIVLADLDSDGDLDAAVANGRHWGEGNEVWLLGQGFTVGWPLGQVRSTSYAVAALDLDADGDLDLVTGNDMAPNRWFENDGHGVFTHRGTWGQDEAPTRALVVGDLLGDGRPAVMVINRDAPLELCHGEALATCEAIGEARPAVAGAAGDVDGDGDIDVVVAQRGPGPTVVWRNPGSNGGRWEPERLRDEGRDSRAVALADLDGDDRVDVVVGNLDGANHWIPGRRRGFGRPRPFGGDEATAGLAVSDMDLDGAVDVIGATLGGPSVVYLNDGAWTPVPIDAGDPETYGVAVGRLNRDEWPDVVLVRSGGLNEAFLGQPSEE